MQYKTLHFGCIFLEGYVVRTEKKCTVSFILSSPIFSYYIGIISWKLLTDVSVMVLAKNSLKLG